MGQRRRPLRRAGRSRAGRVPHHQPLRQDHGHPLAGGLRHADVGIGAVRPEDRGHQRGHRADGRRNALRKPDAEPRHGGHGGDVHQGDGGRLRAGDGARQPRRRGHPRAGHQQDYGIAGRAGREDGRGGLRGAVREGLRQRLRLCHTRQAGPVHRQLDERQGQQPRRGLHRQRRHRRGGAGGVSDDERLRHAKLGQPAGVPEVRCVGRRDGQALAVGQRPVLLRARAADHRLQRRGEGRGVLHRQRSLAFQRTRHVVQVWRAGRVQHRRLGQPPGAAVDVARRHGRRVCTDVL